jgi:tetratricopeptide (TPR) repeat protein
VVGVVAASRDVGSDLGGYAAPIAALMHGGPGAPDKLAEMGVQVGEMGRAAVLADRGAWHAVLPVDAVDDSVGHPWGRFVRGPRSHPSDLLRADFGVVPYLFRDRDMDQAVAWCEGVEPVALAQVAGRGGAGKTRFGIELCQRMEDRGWVAGFWEPGDVIPQAQVPRLWVVDYAEAVDPQALRAGLEAARRSASVIAPVRVVLLTRTRAGGRGDVLGGVYEVAPASLRTVLDASADNPAARHRLNPDQRAKLYAEAYARFRVAWWGGDGGSPADRAVPAVLAHERYALPLEVLFEAHDRVLSLDPPPKGVRMATAEVSPVARVLAHEQRYWMASAPNVPGFDLSLARGSVALATLAGAADQGQAGALLALLLPLRGDAAPSLFARACAWVEGLYEGPEVFNPLRPDRLGEALVVGVLREQADSGVRLVAAVLGLPADGQVEHALSVLARITATDPDMADVVARALVTERPSLIERAQKQARPRAGEPVNRALAAALTRLLTGPLAGLLESTRLAPEADQPTYQDGLAEDYERLGDLERDAGRVTEARDLYTKSLGLYEQLAAADPDNPTYWHGLGVSYERLGDLERDAGRVQEARDLYTKSLGYYEQLAAADPDNPAYQYGLGTDYVWLGDLELDAGRVQEARDLYTKSLGYYEQLAAADPDNPTYQYGLGADYMRLGDLERDAGRVTEARDLYTRMLVLDERLAAADPDNPTYQYALGVDYQELGDLERDAGRVQEARDLYTKSLGYYEQLAAAIPDNPTYWHGLGADYRRLGDLERDAGRVQEARDLYTKSLGYYEQSAAANPDNRTYRHDLEITRQRLSEP